MTTHAYEALLRLLMAGGALAPRRALLQAAGDAQAAIAQGSANWRAHGCTPEQCAALERPDRRAWTATLRWLEQDNHDLLPCTDPAFPPSLLEVPNPPLALFVAGDPCLAWRPSVALVGSRSPTLGGRALAARFAGCFVEAGLAVTSGLAAGIDATAHQATLDAGGCTVAVIGTVVVEAAQRSGALITARLAAEAGREVCALPGSVLNPRAAGCHRLIREGAALVERPEDVLELLAPALRQQLPGLQSRLATPTEQAPPALLPARWADDPDYQCLWRALDHNPSGMDSLITRCGLTASQVSSMLLAMELAAIVVCVHGRYCRTP